jgi:hypothetical protein
MAGQRQLWTTDWSRRSSGGSGPLHQLAEAFANPAQFVRGVDAAAKIAANGQSRRGLQEDHGIMLPDVVKACWPLCSTKLRLLADRETLNTVWRAVVEALTARIGPEFRAWCLTRFRYHDLEREIKIPVDSKHAGMFHTSDSVDLFGFVRYGMRITSDSVLFRLAQSLRTDGQSLFLYFSSAAVLISRSTGPRGGNISSTLKRRGFARLKKRVHARRRPCEPRPRPSASL